VSTAWPNPAPGRRAIPDEEVREAIDASYDAVVAKLPRKYRPTQ